MKTPTPKPSDIQRDWYVVDAQDQVLGRMATKIAHVLRGKNKPYFAPHADTGDFVVVINADKVRFTGKKETDKTYWRHTGYVGGIKGINPQDQREKHPERIVHAAVRGMLPKGPLGRRQLKKLKIYNGTEHPHGAQQPKPLN